MAELTYNGQTLNFISTQGVEFDPVVDELAGVDLMYTRVMIRCTAVITPNVTPWVTADVTATAAMARVAHMLNTPRRGLTFKVGGVTLVSVMAGSDTTAAVADVKNGPTPKASVTRIVGTESYLVSFQVETYVVDCPEQGNGTTGGAIGSGTASGSQQYVSHRWTETVELTQNAMTKRTRQGRIVARADLTSNADQLRGIVAPPLEPDFARVSSTYTLQADGRVLSYTFVDEEQYLNPPRGAAKAEGRMVITTSNSAAYFAEVSLRLIGHKGGDKAFLMSQAFAIAMAKIQLAAPVQDRFGVVTLMGSLAEDMYANDVTVRLRAQVQPARARMTTASVSSSSAPLTGSSPTAQNVGGAIAPRPATRPDGQRPGLSMTEDFAWLKVPQEYVPQQFDPGDRGTAGLLMVAAALQDPCLRQTVIRGNQKGTNDPTDIGSATAATIHVTDYVADTFDYRAPPEQDGIYTVYEVDSHTVSDLHKFLVPVGKKDAAPAIIQTAMPTKRRQVTWRAVKYGGPPSIPDPALGETNWVLVQDQISLPELTPAADGSILRYEVAGCYDYVWQGGPSLTVSLTAGVPPWVDQTAAAAAAQNMAKAVKGILEPWLGFGLSTSQLSTAAGVLFASGGLRGPNLENG